MFRILQLIALLCVLMAGAFAAPVNTDIEDATASTITNTLDDNIANLVDPEAHELAPAHVGQATFYQAGLGACGVTNNGDVEDIVALPHGMMGQQSNGNPFCGRRVMITYNGKQSTGTVQDKCMGCTGRNIDLSKHLFKKFAPFSVGRIYGVEWHFI